MAGLQRSAVSFRRQGSSGLVFDDKFLSGELNKVVQSGEEQEQGRNQEEVKGESKEVSLPKPIPTINTLGRSRSNGGGRRYRTGNVPPTIEPPSPRVSACGFCSAFSKPASKTHHRTQPGLITNMPIIHHRLLWSKAKGMTLGLSLLTCSCRFDFKEKLSDTSTISSSSVNMQVGFSWSISNVVKPDMGELKRARIFELFLLFSTITCLSAGYARGFDSLLQLPQSRSNKTWTRTKRILSVDDFGAKGDGIADDSRALKKAWKAACSLPTRTAVEIPAGSTYLVHPITLSGPCRSKLIFRISGTINAPADPGAWASLNPNKWIYFHGVNHLTVEGGGTINGRGHEWWARSCKINTTNPCQPAPTALTFSQCKNLRVRDVVLIDSQQMHLAFKSCLRVVASGLKLIAPASSPNTDGIHISASKGVKVLNCTINTGDDCISIVSNSSRVHINNIACSLGHGISVGSLGKFNSWSQVRGVTVDGAILSNTQNGVRIKTWQGGTGLASNITFKNVWMDNVSYPIVVDQYYCDSHLPCANQSSAVKVENVSFVQIRGTSATKEAMRFACSDSSPCRGLYLEDIQLASNLEKPLKSFCWAANGTTTGLISPPPCFPGSDTFLRQEVTPSQDRVAVF